MAAKKRRKNQKIRLIRWLLSLVVVAILFYLSETEEIEEIRPGEVPVLFANVCGDNLETVFVDAIQSARHSIHLIIYSLSDSKIIKALNHQAENGIEVKVVHDTSTPPFGFQKLASSIDNQGIKMSGLMHQKILVVDNEKIWIGSANMTAESLKLHDNLVVAFIHGNLAESILTQKPFTSFSVGGQRAEFWNLPKGGKEGLQRLLELMDEAKESIRIGMFTWTHADLVDAAIRAHKRGVKVQIVMDQGQANGVCVKALATLAAAKMDVRLSSGLGLLHHKFAWIDEKILVNGSANWTVSAFTRNRDCFLILHSLTEAQNEKLQQLWQKTLQLADKEHLPVFGQGPKIVGDDLFELIGMAA